MRRVLGALSASAPPLGVAAAAFTVAVGLPAGDPDMWWHLASGRWMVEHRDGLRVDVFSSTATGEPYALGQWLGEVVLYLAYAAGSWTGVAVLRAALVALAAFAVTRLALRYAPARVAIPLVVLALLLSKPTWTDRPQLFTLAFFPLILDLCLAARRTGRPAGDRREEGASRAALIATVPLAAAWANLHGGYALGIAILWIFALEALLERRPVAGPLAAAMLATVIVSVAPGALSLLRAAGQVAGSTVRIVEESPVDVLTPFGALFALFVGATLAVTMLRGGSLLGALVLVPMLWLALSAQRHVPLFGFAAVPFLAGPITCLMGDIGTTLGRVRAFARSDLQIPSGSSLPDRAGSDAPSPPSTRVHGHRIGVSRHQIGVDPRASPIEHPGAPDGTHVFRHQVDDARHQIDDETHARSEDEAQATSAPERQAPGPSSAVSFNEASRAGVPGNGPDRTTGRSDPSSSSSFRVRRGAPVLAGALWLGALASIATADPGPDLRPYPEGARAALIASSGILLNEYDWGGYLIWNVPSRPVFVDGRLYPFAGNGVIRAYQEAIHVLPPWRGVIERWNVTQALVRPDRALAQALRDEGWRVRAEGEGFVLLERTEPKR